MHSRDALFLADHQETIQHAQVRFGIGAGKHQQHLVRVGQNHLLVIALGGRVEADQGALARFNLLDHRRGSVRLERNLHPVADRQDISAEGHALEPAAQVAGKRSLIRPDGVKSRLDANDGAREWLRGSWFRGGRWAPGCV